MSLRFGHGLDASQPGNIGRRARVTHRRVREGQRECGMFGTYKPGLTFGERHYKEAEEAEEIETRSPR